VGDSSFIQFLISGFLQHSLRALSAFQQMGNQFPVTNTPGFEIPNAECFPDWTPTDTAISDYLIGE